MRRFRHLVVITPHFRKVKLFVTGATGFVGSHFVQQALAAGHDVVGLKRSEDSAPRIPLQQEPIWLTKPMDEVSSDDLVGHEVLVHLAAHTANVPYDTLEACFHWNVTVPLQLARRSIESGVRHFIIAGSCFEFGTAALRYDHIPPDAPLEPSATYPASKAAASLAFRSMAIEEDLELAYLRIFQVFGEGEAETRFWPSLRRAALAGEDFAMTTAEQIRDFTPVEDVAKQLLSAATDLDLEPGRPVFRNIGTGRPQSLRDFAEHWWEYWNASGKLLLGKEPYRPNEVMRYVPEITSH